MFESHSGQKHYSGKPQARSIIKIQAKSKFAPSWRNTNSNILTTLGYWEDTKCYPETAERVFLHGYATIPWNGTHIKDRDLDKLRPKSQAAGCTRRQYEYIWTLKRLFYSGHCTTIYALVIHTNVVYLAVCSHLWVTCVQYELSYHVKKHRHNLRGGDKWPSTIFSTLEYILFSTTELKRGR